MVECPICSKLFKQLTNKHLSMHSMTTKDFKIQFPSHQLVSEEVRQKNKANGKVGKVAASNTQHNRLMDRVDEYHVKPFLCMQCHAPLPYTKRHNRFCDRTCAGTHTNIHRSFVMSDETKQQISTKLKALGVNPRLAYKRKYGIDYISPGGTIKRVARKTTVCSHCHTNFEHRITERRVFCSNACRKHHIGGYQPNSTIVHRHIYNGVTLDSGAELTFAKLLDRFNLPWHKNSSTYFWFTDRHDKQRKYYPDFFLPTLNMWVEIKGKRYIREDDDLRMAAVGNIIRVMSTDLRNPDYVLGCLKLGGPDEF